MTRRLQLAVKRVFDLLVSLASLILLLPLFAAIALAIRLDSPGPVFFVQDRVGLRGRLFRMIKLRTMVNDAVHRGTGVYTSTGDPRITRVGKLLRRLSLDELPQLWNILLGDMSVVGPRPALPYHANHYSEQDSRRLEMRPGVTGWSQINGRNSISWPERIQKDIWYVENFSLWLDARILARTPLIWLSGEGLYGEREKFFFSGQDDIPVPPKTGSK